jgi:hypothetical protein
MLVPTQLDPNQLDLEDYLKWLDEQERIAAYEREQEEGK